MINVTSSTTRTANGTAWTLRADEIIVAGGTARDLRAAFVALKVARESYAFNRAGFAAYLARRVAAI